MTVHRQKQEKASMTPGGVMWPARPDGSVTCQAWRLSLCPWYFLASPDTHSLIRMLLCGTAESPSFTYWTNYYLRLWRHKDTKSTPEGESLVCHYSLCCTLLLLWVSGGPWRWRVCSFDRPPPFFLSTSLLSAFTKYCCFPYISPGTNHVHKDVATFIGECSLETKILALSLLTATEVSFFPRPHQRRQQSNIYMHTH